MYPEAEQIWLKACPNLGVSFDMAVFHSLALDARQKPTFREEFFRTRLNIWTNAASKIFDMDQVRRGMREDLKIADFRQKKCWVGVDLSRNDDLSVRVALFELDNGDIVLFPRIWCSGDAPLLKSEDHRQMVRPWLDAGLLEKSLEGGVDFSAIEADLRDLNKWFDVQIIGFDPAMAGQMMKNLEDDRIPVVPYYQRATMMTAPVDDMIARAHTGSRSTMLYPEHPAFEWTLSNAHGERKKDGTILPFKDSADSLEKIDGTVAAAIANGLRLNPEFTSKKKPSIYEKRGLIGADHVLKRDTGNQQGAHRPS
jgi:phage terminase large subunit-like protein